MLAEVTGLVLRETNYGESDKILTVLTAEAGKLSVYAKGVRNYRNHYMSISTQMCYNEFVLHEKGGNYWFREAANVVSFYHIREDLIAYALAQYCLDILDQICVANSPEPGLLQLGLNTLYLLEKGEKDHRFIKAVFEMRAAALAGFLPELSCCARCGNADATYYLDVANGSIVCADCIANGGKQARFADEHERAMAGVCLPLNAELLYALRYICSAPPKRVFSFSLSDAAIHTLSTITETYLQWHTDRKFESLQFYKEMVQTMAAVTPNHKETHD